MKATPFVTALLVLASSPALADSRTPDYWNVTFDGRPLTCRRIAKASSQLPAFFEARHGLSCATSDEGDHLRFRCGDIDEVVLFSRESCMGWEKKPKTELQTRTMVAFQGCMEQAKPSLGLDNAVRYCGCSAKKLSVFSEEQMAKLPLERFRGVAEKCLATLGIAAASDVLSMPANGSVRAPPTQEVLESSLQAVCNTGMVVAQQNLPRHPDANGLLERGYASCQGALARWKTDPGGLAGMQSPVEFVCGYAIGAMFAKYGFGGEVQGTLSARALKAAQECASTAQKLGITSDWLSTMGGGGRAN